MQNSKQRVRKLKDNSYVPKSKLSAKQRKQRAEVRYTWGLK